MSDIQSFGRCVVTSKALSAVYTYLHQNYDEQLLKKIINALEPIINLEIYEISRSDKNYTYELLQAELACLDEKSEFRKQTGRYYTPNDVVEFILTNSVNLFCDKIEPTNLNKLFIDKSSYAKFCYDCTFYDPTCGSGVFLLPILETKFKCLEKYDSNIDVNKICRIVDTLYGNDLNANSILITKLRLFLSVLNRYGTEFLLPLNDILNKNFSGYDFISRGEFDAKKYNLIIGNPPYVEDKKSQTTYSEKYGNLYANVLSIASRLLKTDGVMGFIVPLSYIATPRMKKIRAELLERLPEQYIFSFADRPDSLFSSVHQKLCILLGKKKKSAPTIFTGNYNYRYRDEREKLFNNLTFVANDFYCEEFIPKFGTETDIKIYKKIMSAQRSLAELFVADGVPFYLNMRAAFWIKVFLREHSGSEYKIFKCSDEFYAALCVILLNSSLFWWYWICVSDCWHITKKELSGFKLPTVCDLKYVKDLATSLENCLEKTKVYVGTKQTDYEYKHKFCVKEIHQIDDYVNSLYNLSFEESSYIKNFAYRYRIGGGLKDECH